MKFLSLFALVILLFSAKITFAYTPVGGNLTAILGAYIYKNNFNGSSTGANSPTMGSVTLIANGDIDDKSSLEIGLFFLNQFFFRELNNNFISENIRTAHVSVGYRRWWNEAFSTALAFYTSTPMGDPRIIHNDFAPSTDFGTSARDDIEYGFDGSVQAEVWRNNKIGVVIDARYSISVTNREHEHGDTYGALIGIKYLVQEKFLGTQGEPEDAIIDNH